MATADAYEHITFEVDEGVALVTLNRPERLNAFTGRMGDELGDAYARCDRDDAVRAVVLTGAGRAFCAGADFERGADTFAVPTDGDEAEAWAEPGRPERSRPDVDGDEAEVWAEPGRPERSRPDGSGAKRQFTASPVTPRAWEVRKPVIAAINGHAIGIGLTIPMQCDIRFVAEEAKLGFVHVRRGVIPDAHSHWTVPRAAGFAVAAELLLTGREIRGREAVTMGLASRALPAPDVLSAALELAHDVARNTAPLSVALSKRLLWSSPTLDRDEVERLETELHRVVMGREDAREGVVAFVEKRAPRWTLSPTRDWPDDWPDGLA